MSKKIFRFFNKQKEFEQDVPENGMRYSGFYGDSFKRLKKNKMAMFCAMLLILIILVAIFAPVLAPYDPTYQDYSAVLASPSPAHPFGTDEYGRDILIALGLLTWVRTARMIRGSVMQLKEKEYIEASRANGATTFWIITKGLIPNCLSTIIVLVTLGIPNAIMYEASLSFLGIGIQPPTPSWGNMISAAQTFISYRPLYSIMPGVAIMITVIAFNIFGDGLRDAPDPKLKS